MRLFFASALLFICSTVFSQDMQFISSISKTDRENARLAADKIAALATLSYRFYKVAEEGSVYVIIYAPVSLTDADLESKNEWNECLYVEFRVSENASDLKFQAIRGKYLDVFPAWKKYFKEKAHLEYTITDPESREIADNQRGYRFVLQEGNNARVPRWSILNKL